MPFSFGTGGGRAGGVLGLGPAQNTFGDSTTADRAAAETLRDTYATNNATWLTQYDNNLSFWIRLVWDTGVVEQRRNAGGTDWEDVSNVIRGQTGNTGAQGEFRATIYRNSATDLDTAPTGGSYVVATEVLTAPTDWTTAPAQPAAGETIYESYADIDPSAGGTITPTWSVPIAQGQGKQGAFRIQTFQNAAANPGTPTDGSFNVETGVLTAPTNWATTATAPAMGEETFVSEAFINPETQSGDVTPTWNYPYDHGAASQLFTIVDVTGVGPPAPSASTIPHLYLDTEIPRAWLTQAERNYTNNPTGTFATFARAGYIGDYRTFPPDSAVNAVGDIWYRHSSTHAWYRVVSTSPPTSNLVTARTALGATTTWLGDQPDRQAALDRIANFDNARSYVFYNEDTGNVEELDNSSYMAQTATLAYSYTSIELENDVYDSVKQVLVGGNNVSIDLDEDAGTITINATGGGGTQTPAQIVAALEGLSGNNRLNATALRLIASQIDAELGSTDWRTGGGGGLTIDQVVTMLEARTGDNRLDASAALRLIADALDTELGQADWRTGGTGTVTGAQIVTALQALTGTNRLNATAVQAIATQIDAELGNANWRTQNPDQTGPEIVTLLEALTDAARLNAVDGVRMVADAIDAELSSTDWRTGGGGTADGVVNGFAFADDGTVTITRTVGADVTEDISANLKDFLGARAQLGSPTVYTAADDDIITTVAHDVEIGDQIVFLTPATIGTEAGNLTFGISVDGTEMHNDPLRDIRITNLTASDVRPSHLYVAVRLNNFWALTEPLEQFAVAPGTSVTWDGTTNTIAATINQRVADGQVIIVEAPAGISGTDAITFTLTHRVTTDTGVPLQDADGTAVTGDDLTAGRDYFFYRNGTTSYRLLGGGGGGGITLATALAAVMVAAPITVDRTTDGQITLGLAADGVTNAHIADDAVDTDQIADDAVESAQIADDAVTLAAMADNSVDSDQYVNGSIDLVHLAAAIVARLIPAPGNTLTLTSPTDTTILSINGSNVDNQAVLRLDVGQTGGMKAFQAGRTGETLAWASFEGGLGGSNEMPGIAFGPGTGARDVRIYRGGANILTTNSQFRAAGAVFSAVVEGVTPTADNHLATKEYVDGLVNPPVTHPSLYFGTSTDATPVGAELTIAGSMGSGEIPAYAGSMHVLIARLDSEGDLTTITRSDDVSGTNQLGAFTKFGTTVQPTGETVDYAVWVSNQALTQTADVTWSAS